ncbi:MAG TPA: tRNA preQ1(34) S-adenosylmethionine ribosyltransferase-isomerase QueA [bacterium]|nr:tRNA preQ1(34) S-adenosylmethionine ribosyltransferase-isomerase QueA [bacterium]
MYSLSDYDFILPEKLIAQKPAVPRDHCRLLVYKRDKKETKHDHFYNLKKYLPAGSLLVFNDSQVIPARLLGQKQATEGKFEIFLLKQMNDNLWEVLLKGKNKKAGMIIRFHHSNLQAKILEPVDEQRWLVEFNYHEPELGRILNRTGLIPLPPYIKIEQSNTHIKQWLKKQYQTIYADSSKKGSVAAPTAGLHFTQRLLKGLENAGTEFAKVTLHVGLGTFSPVRHEDITQHKMHSELGMIDKKTLLKILEAKKVGRPIISVGTTTVRVLEGLVAKYLNYSPEKLAKLPDILTEEIGIFIYPGYHFKILDGLITNFHLPKSTLLMLVSAMTGKDELLNLYKIAVQKKYHFFSFGDAMLIL